MASASATSSSSTYSDESSESTTTSPPSNTESDVEESEYTQYDLVQKLSLIGSYTLPRFIQIPKKSRMDISQRQKKHIDMARAVPVPPSFEKVVTTWDEKLTGGECGAHATNLSTKIFEALASVLFNTSVPIMATHTKLLYLKQLQMDYLAAKSMGKDLERLRCLRLINRTMGAHEVTWIDEEWVAASKAFFVPIHVLQKSSRAPPTPHVRRYAFSPVLDDELPIRIVVELTDFSVKTKSKAGKKNSSSKKKIQTHHKVVTK